MRASHNFQPDQWTENSLNSMCFSIINIIYICIYPHLYIYISHYIPLYIYIIYSHSIYLIKNPIPKVDPHETIPWRFTTPGVPPLAVHHPGLQPGSPVKGRIQRVMREVYCELYLIYQIHTYTHIILIYIYASPPPKIYFWCSSGDVHGQTQWI